VSAAPPDDALALAGEVWREMRRLVLEEFDRRKQAASVLGLSVLRVKALGILSSSPMSMRELADRLAVDPPHTTVIVDGLEERGLVNRRPHPTDRRSKILTLTASGRRAAARASRILNAPPDPVAQLDLATLHELATILELISTGSSPG
jgi:DNA-binding MarR family transcriptional regulator